MPIIGGSPLPHCAGGSSLLRTNDNTEDSMWKLVLKIWDDDFN